MRASLNVLGLCDCRIGDDVVLSGGGEPVGTEPAITPYQATISTRLCASFSASVVGTLGSCRTVAC
jgi:hypothetical protein